MSLFASFSASASGLLINRLGMSVTGNNIANVNTPGYARQRLDLSPITPSQFGSVSVGPGVRADDVRSVVDSYLIERGREAKSEFESASGRLDIVQRIEGVFNELSDTDLSSQLDAFFDSVADVQNNPLEVGVRGVAVQNAVTLAETVQGINERLRDIQQDINTEVESSVDAINRSLDRIKDLNSQIVAATGGIAQDGDAAGLRDLRDQELTTLSGLVEIQTHEDLNGSINIYSGENYLLISGQVQHVDVTQSVEDGVPRSSLVFANSRAEVPLGGGRLGGLQTARDEDLASAMDRLDTFASNLIFEANKIQSSGQGLESFTEVTSTGSVIDRFAALNSPDAGLPFPIRNGFFELRVAETTGQEVTYTIPVTLDGVTSDSLDDVATNINTITGIPNFATISGGKLTLDAPTDVSFTFGEDNTDLLAAIGVNTLFTGSLASDIGVNERLREQPALLSASRNGNPGDTSNIVALGNLRSESVGTLGGLSLTDYLAESVQQLGNGAQAAQAQTEILQSTSLSLESQSLAITGVSLDEEVLKLTQFQRAFQASARHISVVNELIDEVLNLAS
ncbi:Flagellar hook-associated protein 1 [Planctomycetes bacterium Pan216]|uniref:Flagellar hook-associated protein 1 n=1 Tax=Kolteria novifilia TaxID=2527975 RepID=A0A518AXT8_9BACT|nr:Flagellar hook-associated protein 1 [Planctomycetes bacterium Pan216]